MKKYILLLAIVIIMWSPDASRGDDTAPGKAIAYYFYGSYRCATCQKLESYSKEALETNFKNELASGKLEFRAVNVENAGNEHFVGDYQLYTKALVVSLTKDGKETKSKNLVKIWDYVGNKKKFMNYVTEEVSSLLKEI